MIRKCKEHGYFRGEVCPECGNSGRYVLDDEREERLGRFVSGALRHFPDDVGLTMDKQGWVNMDLLCDIMERRYRWASRERLVSLVESDVKNRYEITGSRIRARYGHSVDVELDYPENELPYLYYGVSQEEVDMLLDAGIAPLRQTYVHLSTTPEKATESASVHTENPVVLEIDADEAQNDGIEFMAVNSDIVLAESVPPEYLVVVEMEE
ncbi:RNA 2'-phosphotransferase [Methanococcoides methylutens]|uniref:Probable RNA 2'-phosphotransferase n=1 Tax=Methanococcoides methylutens MM1 TaxID=1434104 RepID=A0A0E3SNH2_METMT|nr:RNA 2'-phosphotransferase [Methanococcoides methylutens]AKB84076.1 RNA:NAD 2'-phosphotransferase [Methanococcoides methylutens MM1]